MDPNRKLHAWRKAQGLSTRQLETMLAEAMRPEYPDHFPSGVQVFQSDISDAENGLSEKKFNKVANAVYKYFHVEEGSFGSLVLPNKMEIMTQARDREAILLTEMEVLKGDIRRLEKMVDQLQNEKMELAKRCWELEAQIKAGI